MDSGNNPPYFPGHNPFTAGDSRLPLENLSTLTRKMDSLHRFLSQSITHNTLLDNNQMHFVSSQITSALHQIILNGTALLTSANLTPQITSYLKPPVFEEDPTGRTDLEEEEEMKTNHVVEIDAVELLAEHVHFCEICGKGFKRDANLRMHMRAHGNQFKTPEALAKPDCNLESSTRKTRFSCPYVGCNRNKSHTKFQPLKSVICVKNHFKRSHCPKMYPCNRCNKKSFSVVSDLKSHVKHCGESKWRCSCGTTFSRKDKLFGHMALFEGHMPEEVDDERAKGVMDFNQNEQKRVLDAQFENFDSEFFDGLGGIDNDYFKDVFGSPTLETRMWEFYDLP